MKVYFTASTAELKKHKTTYLGIREFIVNEGHLLTRDWLPHTLKMVKDKIPAVRDIKDIYKACMKAINEADVVIIEDTVSNFSTGNQITVSLQRQKPTLVLWQGQKHKHFNNSFINGIESEFLEVFEYKNDEYKDIIKIFLKKFENSTKRNRFHLVLNEVERKYLDWAQFSKNKSRTKVIRENLRKAIKEDKDYQKYLKS